MTALLAEQQRRRQLADAVAASTTSGRALQSVAIGIATIAAELAMPFMRSDHSAPALIIVWVSRMRSTIGELEGTKRIAQCRRYDQGFVDDVRLRRGSCELNLRLLRHDGAPA